MELCHDVGNGFADALDIARGDRPLFRRDWRRGASFCARTRGANWLRYVSGLLAWLSNQTDRPTGGSNVQHLRYVCANPCKCIDWAALETTEAGKLPCRMPSRTRDA